MSPKSSSLSAPGLHAGPGALIGAGLAYFAANEAALLFPDAARVLTAVWPAGGIGLAALLLSPRSRWPAMLAVMFVAGNAANLLSGRSFAASAGFMTANVLESLACAALIQRACGPLVRFCRMREIFGLAFAATAVNGVTALLGAATAHWVLGAGFGASYKTWWIADGLGIFLVAPLIVTWARPDPARAGRRGGWLLELALVIAVALAFAWAYFRPHRFTSPLLLHSYMLIVPLAWAALRLGPRGVATVVAALAVSLMASTVSDYGLHPMGGLTATEHVQWVQLLLGVVSGVGYLLAASTAHHEELERSLREAEAGLRDVGDNLPNGVVYQIEREPGGPIRFRHLSAGLERLLGLAPAAVLRDASLFHRQILEADRGVVDAARAESLQAMGVFNVVVRMRRADGEIRRVNLSSAPRQLSDGRIVWNGILTDITEQEEAQQALRESEARYRRLVEHAPIGISLLLDERIIYANPEAARIVGARTAAEILGRSVRDFMTDDLLETMRQRMELMAATGRSVPPIEILLRRLDGSRIDVETRGLPVQHEGRVAVQNLLVDISERKQTDLALRRSASQLRALTSRLQSLREEERTRLAREIHDHLGQLLTALSLDLRLIERKLPQVGEVELRSLLQGKVAAARSLADETVAAVQKIATELRPAVLDRLGLEAAIESEARAFERRSGVRLQLSLPADGGELPSELATALFRILQELLTNVARHAKASEVNLRLERAPDAVILTVRDNGVGIQDADVANASSLGLLGMRERAELLGGSISFGRNAGPGTAVMVRLPLNGAAKHKS